MEEIQLVSSNLQKSSRDVCASRVGLCKILTMKTVAFFKVDSDLDFDFRLNYQ
ncbi:hypothetical protein Pla144_42920 [Bythopirellula polymerisocia]|uniref:Uncharacterized protein n=1 Tax=Bythopirellula polymerisocia TaxID=2528003 RepID=A0A5C6CHS1_9BACT|nr:hypothetical protein Pla144_42920 [Bythopirellula polymerisocia]